MIPSISPPETAPAGSSAHTARNHSASPMSVDPLSPPQPPITLTAWIKVAGVLQSFLRICGQLGKAIGTRTWGGEIWLSGSNVEADGGIATAAETGVYGPQGKWLIEGHGVDPDIVVDNLPHATFNGADAQLQAALDLLKQEIQSDPR